MKQYLFDSLMRAFIYLVIISGAIIIGWIKDDGLIIVLLITIAWHSFMIYEGMRSNWK